MNEKKFEMLFNKMQKVCSEISWDEFLDDLQIQYHEYEDIKKTLEEVFNIKINY